MPATATYFVPVVQLSADMDDAPHRDARYLAGSPVRIAVLRELDAEPRRPAALTERVDATRTTVQRILAGFRERDWVRKADARYRLTATGDRVRAAYEDLLAEADRAREVGPLVANVDAFEAGLPPAALEVGEVTVADDRDPFAPVDRFLDVFADAAGGHVRAVSPIVSRAFNESAVELLDAGTTIDLIIDRAVLAASESDFEPALRRAIEDGSVSVYVHPEPVETGLCAFADTACLAAYDDGNNMRALLSSDAAVVRNWVDDRIDDALERSRPLATVLGGEETTTDDPTP